MVSHDWQGSWDRFVESDAHAPLRRSAERQSVVNGRAAQPDRPIPTIWPGDFDAVDVVQRGVDLPSTEFGNKAIVVGDRDQRVAGMDPKPEQHRPKGHIKPKRKGLHLINLEQIQNLSHPVDTLVRLPHLLLNRMETAMGTVPLYDTDRYTALDQWHMVHCAAHLELLDDVARMDREEGWTYDGATSMAGWLMTRYRLSRTTATEWTRVAAAIQGLPAIRAAYGAGRMSWDQVRNVTKFATRETDDELAAAAPSLSVAELNRRAREIKLEDVQEVHRTREFSWTFDENLPVLWFHGKMVASDGVELVKTLTRLASQMPAQPGGTYESFEARCLDALVMLASQQRGSDRDPDRATAVTHIPLSVLTKDEGEASYEDGTALLAETARRLVCDARLQVSLEDDDESVLGVGRMTRTIPPWLARILRKRDHGCRYPGCSRTRWIHFHHLIHWAQGGPTDLDNLISVCPFHHRLVHEDGWRISGDPNAEVTWIKPDGNPFIPGRRDIEAAEIGILMLEDGMVPDRLKRPREADAPDGANPPDTS